MRIALAADEPYAVHAVLRAALAARAHEAVPFGACADGAEHPWAEVAEAAARAVSSKACDEGIFLCWTGTGISIAANKIAGIRAALCHDAQTAAAARIWNHANVLCLSHRTLSDDVAREIVGAWFDTKPGDRGAAGVRRLQDVEQRNLR